MNCVGFIFLPKLPKECWSRCSGQRTCGRMNNVLISHRDNVQQSPQALTPQSLGGSGPDHSTQRVTRDLFAHGVVVGLPRHVHCDIFEVLCFCSNVTVVNGETCCWCAEPWAVIPRCCQVWTCEAKRLLGCRWARSWQGAQPSAALVSLLSSSWLGFQGKHWHESYVNQLWLSHPL